MWYCHASANTRRRLALPLLETLEEKFGSQVLVFLGDQLGEALKEAILVLDTNTGKTK